MYKKSLIAVTALAALGVSNVSGAGKSDMNMKDEKAAPMYRPYYYDENMNVFFAYGEWLRWKPFTETSLDWVQQRELTGGRTSTFPPAASFRSSIDNLEYTWGNGYRVGTGFRFARDLGDSWIRPWQFEGTYTSFRSSDSKSHTGYPGITTAVPSSGLTTLFNLLPIYNSAGEYFTHAESSTHLHYHNFDAMFAWPVWFNDNVIWRFAVGALFSKITDSWNTTYALTGTGAVAYNTDLKWSFTGGGLEVGTDVHVALPQGLGIYADGAGGLAIGRVRTRETYSKYPPTSQLALEYVTRESFHRNDRRLQPMFRLEAGVDYKHWFFNKNMMIHLAIGYEAQLWINLNQFGQVNNRYDVTTAATGSNLRVATTGNFFENEPTNLGFHGLNLRAGLDF